MKKPEQVIEQFENKSGLPIDKNLYTDLVMPNNKELGFMPMVAPYEDERKAAPGQLETLHAAFSEYNAPLRALTNLSKINDNVDLERQENYDPIREGLLDDVPEQYWAQILLATRREDALKIKQRLAEELENQDILDRSGWLTSTVSILGASIADPTTLIPMSQTVKYASIGKGAFANFINAGKAMAGPIALQNAILVGTKESQDISDWAIQTMFETAIAAGIGGIVGAYAAKGAKTELSNMKAVFKAVDGVDIKYKLSPEGIIEKPVASAAEGSSVGAAQVKGVQDLLDAGEISFKSNKTVKAIFGWGSPIIKGLTNRFETMRRFTSQLMPHPFETAGGKAGAIQNPDAFSFVKSWRHVHANAEIFTKAMWMESLGLEGVGKGIRAVSGSWTGKYQTLEAFKEQVGLAYSRKKSDIPQIQACIDLYRKEIYEPLWNEVIKRRPDLKKHEFTNIEQWLNRVYHKGKIQERPDEFIADFADYLTKNNDTLKKYYEPFDTTKRTITELKQSIETAKNKIIKPREKTALAAETRLAEVEADLAKAKSEADRLFPAEGPEKPKYLKAATEKLEAEQIKLRDKLAAHGLPETESAQIKTTIKAMEEEVALQEKYLAELDKNLDQAISEGLIPLDLLEGKVELNATQIAELEKLKKLSKDEIQQLAEDGKISKDLYFLKRGGYVELLNPEANPKLRRILNGDEIQDTANGVRDTIMNLNEEQILGEIFRSIESGGNDVFKTRTALWNDALAEKWLVRDIDQLAGLYVDQVSKRIYFDDILKSYGLTPQEGLEGIVSKLLTDRNIEESKILQQPDSPARVKELNKLNKDFDDTKKFMSDMYKIYMGNYVDNTTTAYRISDGIKKFAAATLLGNVPIVQITEFVSPLFRFMFDEYINDGLVASLKRMSYVAERKLNTAEKSYLRGAFADLGQGINVANGARTQALMGYGSQYQPKTVLERYVNNLANWSQNVNLANFIMDTQETIASFASQSSLLRTLQKYVDGKKLSDFEINKLDRARLNPNDWAKRILNQYGINKTEEGAFVANFHLWKDFEAAQRFRIAIEKEVRQVIMKPGPMDVPFALRDPLLSLMTQFTSYIFAATNNFTIPLLTSPDVQKMTGALMMLATGAMVDPLRQLAKGEELNLDPKALMISGINNSGIMSWQSDVLLKANATLGLPPLEFLQSDRIKSKAALFGLGPGLSLGNTAASVFSAFLNGEMNQRDANNAMKLMMPLAYTWYTRRPLNAMLESMNLPKDRQTAKRLKQYED